MKNQSLHLIKEVCRVQKEIIALEQQEYDIHSQVKAKIEAINHLIDELIIRVQIDCNEEDLNNEIKETLLTGGKI